ncbi:MAG: hypothetical protein JNG82_10600 [Opitutaceae bacterium]|nr:hypothetical protein [Opitutaceae bacterium]
MNHPDPLPPGAIDTHVHSAPDVIERKIDDLELVAQARAAGMRAVVLKNHHNCTCGRAGILNRLFPDFRAFGGLVLNHAAGGFNCHAVDAAIRMGASHVWMPTKSAANHQTQFGGRGGLTIMNGAKLRDDVRDILRQIADADVILATGHLAPEESRILIEEALAVGVKRISVTHPEWGVTAMPVETQRTLAATGAVYFERCLVSAHPGAERGILFDTIVQQIRAVGVGSTIAATDYGMPQFDTPANGMRTYAARLRDAGFASEDIRLMFCENAARLLRLPSPPHDLAPQMVHLPSPLRRHTSQLP